MKLRRIANPKGWTTIPTKALADDEISFRAAGVLAYLLSRPPGWETDSKRLAAGKRREGRDAIRSALKELELRGYLHRVKVRRPAGMTLDGRYVGGQITTEYFVSDHPVSHPSEVLELVDELPADTPPDAEDWKPGPGDDEARKTGDNPVEGMGITDPPGTGKPTPENPAPLTRPDESIDPESQGDLTSSSTGEAAAGLPAVDVHPMLAALAESDAPIGAALSSTLAIAPIRAALSSTLAIERSTRLEPRIQMFALRAHLVDVLGYQPTFDLVADWVERAHESARTLKRGRLMTGEVVAYVASFASLSEPESSRCAAAPPGGLPAADGPAAPGEHGGHAVPIPAGPSPARLGGLGG